VNSVFQSQRARSRDRQLTRQRFELLLSHLAADPEAGPEDKGARYEMLRGRLVLFFSRRRAPLPEDCADEVLNRLARRLEEGELIGRVEGYALGIARHVALEQYARSNRESAAAEAFHWNVSHQTHTTDEDEGIRLERMEQCLELLPRSDQELLTKYCLAEGTGKIATRRRLADVYGVTPAALRKRIFLLRGMIQRCIERKSEPSRGPAEQTAARERRRV